MARPRFQLVRGITLPGAVPSWPGAETATVGGEWFGWRLLSSNNRELGRGVSIYPTDPLCRAAAAAGQELFDEGRPMFVLDAKGLWRWQLALAGEPFAAGSRGYQRQRECRYSLTQFQLALPEAEFSATDVIGTRAGTSDAMVARRGQVVVRARAAVADPQGTVPVAGVR